MKKVLIFQGGWDGHEPKLTSARFARMMEEAGYAVEVYDTQDCLADAEKLMEYDLIVACWTMGTIPGEYVQNISRAVANGTGLAGCHGGMCDAFRDNTEWQFMTGGQWVSHPGGDGVKYRVNIRRGSSPLTTGIEDFDVCTEQYYVHVDPANEVLATTRYPVVNYYHAANGEVDVPVAWTRRWGHGRVYYCSLGHHDDVFNAPQAQEMMRRGFLWAAEGKQIFRDTNADPEKYANTAKMY